MTEAVSRDAIALLESDHVLIDDLFAQYVRLARSGGDAAHREELAERICTELSVHTRLEEELFYPALREALEDDDVVDDAEDAHTRVKDLIAQVLASSVEDELFDARVTVLSEYVAEHVRTEREVLFPRLRASGCDVAALGRSIAVRREELHAVADALREHVLVSMAA